MLFFFNDCSFPSDSHPLLCYFKLVLLIPEICYISQSWNNNANNWNKLVHLKLLKLSLSLAQILYVLTGAVAVALHRGTCSVSRVEARYQKSFNLEGLELHLSGAGDRQSTYQPIFDADLHRKALHLIQKLI